jgi:hypothetical protein
LPDSIVKLGAADIGEIVQQAGVGGGLSHDAAQLSSWDPGIAILDVGEDVSDWTTVDRERQSLARFQLGNHG